jgi:hypothetical protein
MVGWFRGNLKFNRMIYFQKCLHNSEKAYKCARYLTFWHPDNMPEAVRRDLDLIMWLRQESNADEKLAPLSASRQHAGGCSSGPGFDNVAPPGIECRRKACAFVCIPTTCRRLFVGTWI